MTPEIATLTLRDLEYIVAIARHGSFQTAAQSCAVSQPALSGQVKKVELALGVELFERSNKGVLVTKIGKKIIEQCVVVLDELETIGNIARKGEQPFEGVFRLGVASSVFPFLIPVLSHAIKNLYPSLELVLRDSSAVSLLEQLKIGKYDAVIASPHKKSIAANLASFELWEEPFAVVLGAKSSLAQQTQVTYSDLDIAQMVFLDPVHSLTCQTFELLEKSLNSEASKAAHYTPSLDALLATIGNSAKMAVVPAYVHAAQERVPGISCKTFVNEVPTRTMQLFWRPQHLWRDTFEEFARCIQSQSLSASINYNQ